MSEREQDPLSYSEAHRTSIFEGGQPYADKAAECSPSSEGSQSRLDPVAANLETGVLLERANDGDRKAFDQLVEQVGGRLLSIAHHMLKNFPQVRRWEETDDVLQESLVKLHRSLKEVQPDSVQGFFGLAATLLRRTLIDFSRHYYGVYGLGAKHHSGADLDMDNVQRNGAAADVSHDPLGSLEEWTAFHQAIEKLSEEQREVFSLLWYTGLNQRQAAEVLGVSQRTIVRRMNRARIQLYHLLHPSSTSANNSAAE